MSHGRSCPRLAMCVEGGRGRSPPRRGSLSSTRREVGTREVYFAERACVRGAAGASKRRRPWRQSLAFENMFGHRLCQRHLRTHMRWGRGKTSRVWRGGLTSSGSFGNIRHVGSSCVCFTMPAQLVTLARSVFETTLETRLAFAPYARSVYSAFGVARPLGERQAFPQAQAQPSRLLSQSGLVAAGSHAPLNADASCYHHPCAPGASFVSAAPQLCHLAASFA